MSGRLLPSDELNSDLGLIAESPIQHLPNEILAHIFTSGASARPRRYDELPFPLLVSSITKQWRNVAISSPSVWSNLLFTTNLYSDQWCASLWIPRSGAHPLDITIELLGRPKDWIMKLIVPHAARWRRLAVKAWDRQDMESVLLHLKNLATPLLQHVEFRCLVDEQTDFRDSHTHCLTTDTSALHSIRLRGLCIKSGPSLSGLTALHLESHQIFLTHSEISDLLSASPALTTLIFRLLGFEFPICEDLPVIEVPSLRSLVMNFRHCEETFVRFFALLCTPALENLELIRMDRTHVANFALHFRKQPRPSQYQNVQILKLFSCGGSGEEAEMFTNHTMHNFFTLFPNVSSLYQVDCREDFVIRPHFQSLKSITFSSMLEDQTSWLYNEVNERHAMGKPLARVRISGYTRALDNSHVLTKLCDIVEMDELDDDSDALRYTGESDDEMGDNYKDEDEGDVFMGAGDFSDYSAEEWENDYEDEVEEDAWNSD